MQIDEQVVTGIVMQIDNTIRYGSQNGHKGISSLNKQVDVVDNFDILFSSLQIESFKVDYKGADYSGRYQQDVGGSSAELQVNAFDEGLRGNIREDMSSDIRTGRGMEDTGGDRQQEIIRADDTRDSGGNGAVGSNRVGGGIDEDRGVVSGKDDSSGKVDSQLVAKGAVSGKKSETANHGSGKEDVRGDDGHETKGQGKGKVLLDILGSQVAATLVRQQVNGSVTVGDAGKVKVGKGAGSSNAGQAKVLAHKAANKSVVSAMAGTGENAKVKQSHNGASLRQGEDVYEASGKLTAAKGGVLSNVSGGNGEVDKQVALQSKQHGLEADDAANTVLERNKEDIGSLLKGLGGKDSHSRSGDGFGQGGNAGSAGNGGSGGVLGNSAVVVQATGGQLEVKQVGARGGNEGQVVVKGADLLLGNAMKAVTVSKAINTGLGRSVPTGMSNEQLEQNINNVVKAARMAIARGNSVMHLRLDPPELGSLRIEIKHNAKGVSLQIQVDNVKAQQLFEQHNSQLRQSLDASGLQTNNIEVRLRVDLRNNQGWGQEQQQGQQQQGQNQQQQQYSQQQHGQGEYGEGQEEGQPQGWGYGQRKQQEREYSRYAAYGRRL